MSRSNSRWSHESVCTLMCVFIVHLGIVLTAYHNVCCWVTRKKATWFGVKLQYFEHAPTSLICGGTVHAFSYAMNNIRTIAIPKSRADWMCGTGFITAKVRVDQNRTLLVSVQKAAYVRFCITLEC